MSSKPVRVFVGCASNNEDLESQSVLEWSMRKHSQHEIEITWMQLSRDPASPWYSNNGEGWRTTMWTTPFSGFRWAISELCNFEGEAIYTDSDVIYCADIGELWDEPILPGKVVIAKGQSHGQRYCVSKWSCERIRSMKLLPSVSAIKADQHKHRYLMNAFAGNQKVVQPFGARDFNILDGHGVKRLDEPHVGAIHYTGIPTQFQLKYAIPRLKREGQKHWYNYARQDHPRQDIQKHFDQLLAEAEASGYGIERYRKVPYGEYDIRYGR